MPGSSKERRKLQKKYLYFRTVDHWNSLPEEVVTVKTLNTFKSQLNDLWKKKSLKIYYQLNGRLPR